MITLTSAPLSTNHIYKFVCSPFPRMYMTQAGKDLKEAYQWQVKSQWRKPPLKGPIGMRVVIYYGDKRKHDIDNGNKILFDALTGIVFEDDSQVTELHLIKDYDKESPRVEISIL